MCFAFPAFRALDVVPGWLTATAALAIVALAAWLWIRKVRAEVRSAEGMPFLVSWRRSPAILGAESEPPADGRGVVGAESWPRAAPIVTAPSPKGGSAEATTPMHAVGRPMPTPEMPIVPISGGVHAILVSELAGRVTPPAATPAPATLVVSRQMAVVHDPSAPGQPSDATLQFLPGRLEVEGATRRPDIRFVRQPGRATEVTLGRQAGPPDRHVQLDAATVSRLHARLRFEDDRWTVANLSRTNPVRLNGRLLLESAGPQVLAEGDRMELGEYVLVFRER